MGKITENVKGEREKENGGKGRKGRQKSNKGQHNK